MAIVYNPSEMLKKLAPEAKIKKMLTPDLTVKKAALTFIDAADFIDRKSVADVALKVTRSYQKRLDLLEGKEARAERTDIKADPKLLIQRVQNEVVTQISEEIKANYEGELYEWLPSDAEEADPEHQLNYGKVFRVGEGEMPGDRYGCRCGMNILVNESKLDLG